MIETEAGRGEAYADTLPGGYSVLSIRDSFSPRTYGEAITAAEQAGLDALIIDSASHEWEGAGGVLSMAGENQASGKKGPLVWQMPKMDHQRHFMLRLLATPIPLVIVCMRAKYPMEEVVKNGRKEWARSDRLHPKQSEDILFEMFVHGWIDEQHNFHGTKYTLDSLREAIRDGEPISIETGARLAEWAHGGASASNGQPQATPKPAPKAAQKASAKPTPSPEAPAVDRVNAAKMAVLRDAWNKKASDPDELPAWLEERGVNPASIDSGELAGLLAAIEALGA
jgi:hypothetical protein